MQKSANSFAAIKKDCNYINYSPSKMMYTGF